MHIYLIKRYIIDYLLFVFIFGSLVLYLQIVM